jgi:hypothetical protein
VREREWVPADGGDPGDGEAIRWHVERHFGEVAFVWHETVSDLVRVDVYVVEPSAARPYLTLVTSGMSSRPMTVPADDRSSRYAELMLCLPAEWPMTTEAFRDERVYWPIRLLKTVARLPHEYQTWIAAWHSVPNGDPAEPYAPGTPFAGALVAPMVECGPGAQTIVTRRKKRISLLALVPLHPAEVALKLTRGTDALITVLDRIGASEVFDPARASGVRNR